MTDLTESIEFPTDYPEYNIAYG